MDRRSKAIIKQLVVQQRMDIMNPRKISFLLGIISRKASLKFLSFAPMIIYFIFIIKKNLISFKTNRNLNLYLIFFTFLIVAQPILQGLYVSGKNIIRLTTLAYPAVLIYFLINSKSQTFSRIVFMIFMIIFFIWSSHPTFSIFDFLEKFKF